MGGGQNYGPQSDSGTLQHVYKLFLCIVLETYPTEVRALIHSPVRTKLAPRLGLCLGPKYAALLQQPFRGSRQRFCT